MKKTGKPTRPTTGRVSRPTPAENHSSCSSARREDLPEDQSTHTTGRVSRPTSTKGRSSRSSARNTEDLLGDQPTQRRVSRPSSRLVAHKRHTPKGRVSRPNTRAAKRARPSSSSPDHERPRSKRQKTHRQDDTCDDSSDEFSSESPSDYSDLEEIEDQQATRRPGSIPTEPSTSHVPKKTKEKIIKGEYFDMSKLLPSLLDYEEDPKEKSSEVKPLFFYDWVRCFHTFMSIRLEYAPQELQGMLRHCEIVQDLHGQGRDGILYDARFRRKKEQYPFISWGEYLADIVDGIPRRKSTSKPQSLQWSMAPQPPHLQWSTRPPSQPLQWPAPRPMVCFKYNSTAGCNIRTCKFTHKCRKCGRAGHPAFKCYAKI